MQKPKPAAPTVVEDPAITAARVSAQNQAEAFQTKATQNQLSADTLALRRRFGAFSGVPTSIIPTAFNTGPDGNVITPGGGTAVLPPGVFSNSGVLTGLLGNRPFAPVIF